MSQKQNELFVKQNNLLIQLPSLCQYLEELGDIRQCGYYGYFNYLNLQRIKSDCDTSEILRLGLVLSKNQKQRRYFSDILQKLYSVIQQSTDRTNFAICLKDLIVHTAANQVEGICTFDINAPYRSSITDLGGPEILSFGLINSERAWTVPESKMHPKEGSFKPALFSSQWNETALQKGHYDQSFPNWKKDILDLRNEECFCFFFQYPANEIDHWVACCLLKKPGSSFNHQNLKKKQKTKQKKNTCLDS